MNKEYTVEQWLQELSEKFKKINDPFCGIWLIADGIEFLGKCIHSDDFNTNNHAKSKFKLAIRKIKAFDEYKKIRNMYHKLRCGLTHSMKPEGEIILTKEGPNDIKPGKACISFDQLKKDFEKGVQQVIAGENGVRTDRLKLKYVVVATQDGKETTGATPTNKETAL